MQCQIAVPGPFEARIGRLRLHRGRQLAIQRLLLLQFGEALVEQELGFRDLIVRLGREETASIDPDPKRQRLDPAENLCSRQPQLGNIRSRLVQHPRLMEG